MSEDSNANDFTLSASLEGHEKDVRAVCYPIPGSVFTASRDCTLQAWHEASSLPPSFSSSLVLQASHPINSIAFVPPSEDRPQYPNGLVLAGSYDHTIDVRMPDADVSQDRVRLLTGHKSNVSTLSVSPNGNFIVSGDWDGRVKVWNTNTWEVELELIGPDANDKHRAIWDVLAYSNTIILTGSADHVIRGYSLENKREKEGELQPGVLIRTSDVVRALCRVRKHPSGAHIASAGNDFMIRLWQFNSSEVGVLHGHDSFIYALDSLPTGELVSSSEDRTVRIWKGTSCVQTITHPALSIWSVSVCQKTGDFATGASDNVARIFSRNKDRAASEETIKLFSVAVQQSAIPQQQVGDVNASTLPGPEFLETKAGTKDGQTVMINSGDGSINVYQWSAGQQQWSHVGAVVDSAGQEADETTGFGLGASQTLEMAPQTPIDNDKVLHTPIGPHAVFVTLVQSNFTPALNRIKTVNSKLPQELSLSPGLVAQLESMTQTLAKDLQSIPATVPAMVPAVPTQSIALDAASFGAVVKLVTLWPYKDRLPGLDLLRCMGPSAIAAEFADDKGVDILKILIPSILDYPKNSSTGIVDDLKSVENNAMMALRLIANLFVSTVGQKLAASRANLVVDFLVEILGLSGRKNRNLLVAWTSAASNITSFALREQESSGQNSFGKESLMKLAKLLAVTITESDDGEVAFRSLIALGNLASIPGEDNYAQLVRAANASDWVNSAISKSGEDRIRLAGNKVLRLLDV